MIEIIKYLMFLIFILTGISISLCLFSIFMYKGLKALNELLDYLE